MNIIEVIEDFSVLTSKRPSSRFRVATTLAAAMVPVHGFIASSGAMHPASTSTLAVAKSQIKTFFGQLIKGCLWAAAIAAGMLIYTSFTAKWKEKGWPTIPISALVAADQAMGSRQTPIPLGGAGVASSYSNGVRSSSTTTTSTTSSRQTSLLDLDQYEG